MSENEGKLGERMEPLSSPGYRQTPVSGKGRARGGNKACF
jgi:hypothetical protein